MSNVYLVWGSSGSYEDYEAYPLQVFITRPLAEAFTKMYAIYHAEFEKANDESMNRYKEGYNELRKNGATRDEIDSFMDEVRTEREALWKKYKGVSKRVEEFEIVEMTLWPHPISAEGWANG